MFGYPSAESKSWLHRSYGNPQGSTGQLKSRLEDLKKPWRTEVTPSTLQHSETARLAVDAFLEQGESGYLQAIVQEKELPFLSTLDLDYMNQHSQSITGSPINGHDAGLMREDTADRASLLSGVTSGTYFPCMSDVDPPELELGWPVVPPVSWFEKTEVTLYFQRDKANNIKELFRSLISKAKRVSTALIKNLNGEDSVGLLFFIILDFPYHFVCIVFIFGASLFYCFVLRRIVNKESRKLFVGYEL